jgi:hypothetical protein
MHFSAKTPKKGLFILHQPSPPFIILHKTETLKLVSVIFFEKWPKKAKNATRTLHFLHICICDLVAEMACDAARKATTTIDFATPILHACLIGSVFVVPGRGPGSGLFEDERATNGEEEHISDIETPPFPMTTTLYRYYCSINFLVYNRIHLNMHIM